MTPLLICPRQRASQFPLRQYTRLLDAVKPFTEGGVPSDDVTIVVLEYLPLPAA